MSDLNQEDKGDKKEPIEPPIGSWAFTARMMADIYPEDDFDWDRWKDEMKEQDL